jgi:hypothetical protein
MVITCVCQGKTGVRVRQARLPRLPPDIYNTKGAERGMFVADQRLRCGFLLSGFKKVTRRF